MVPGVPRTRCLFGAVRLVAVDLCMDRSRGPRTRCHLARCSASTLATTTTANGSRCATRSLPLWRGAWFGWWSIVAWFGRRNIVEWFGWRNILKWFGWRSIVATAGDAELAVVEPSKDAQIIVLDLGAPNVAWVRALCDASSLLHDGAAHRRWIVRRLRLLRQARVRRRRPSGDTSIGADTSTENGNNQ